MPRLTEEIIKNNWAHFKACECCNAPVYIKLHTCPICKSMIFEEDKNSVFRAAEKIEEFYQFTE